MGKKKREVPKAKRKLTNADSVRIGADPESYLKQTPVWRFRDFDWDGAWGQNCCIAHAANLRAHIEKHLASLETMTWAEILGAAGGRKRGNNSHSISRDQFTKEARDRLDEKQILADEFFSLRLDAGTRIYGVRELNCLRIVFFDPHHKDHNLSAYQFDN